ncbi:MAG: chemotaxis protein CheA [Pseudomonadota bacterium]
MAGASSDIMADIRAGFFQECEELLEALTDAIDGMRGADGDVTAHTNAAFRAVHSIKGGAAAFGLSDLTDFAHGLETRLSPLREAQPNAADIATLERAADRLALLVGLATAGVERNEDERLSDAALLDGETRLDTLEDQPAPGPGQLSVPAQDGTRAALAALASHALINVSPEMASLPTLEDLLKGTSTLRFDVSYASELSPRELADRVADADPGGLLAFPLEPLKPTEAATPAQSDTATAQPAPASPTIRVGLERIDKLINLVGELVINQAMLTRSAQDVGAEPNSDHMVGLEELMRLTRDIQDSVMQIRAQPVKPLFQRMARICREAADQAAKPVELITEGQETEIDKTVIERLSDPLTHMIRNAVDHAIEEPQARRAAGKPEVGRITLRASHRSGQVILEVMDDGAGIDRAKVRARALERGLIDPNAELSDADIDQLLFRPGFSTSDGVSALSGRGVGMDVVRDAIQGLGGRIAIDSTPGKGTRFEIALPLTLAVLDAMTVRVAGQTLVLPLSTIHETLTIQAENCVDIGKTRVLRYVGRAIALVDVGEQLGYHDRRDDLDGRIAVITESESAPPVALVIDDILEQRQVVIKGLQKGFETAPCVSAATILGDGRIALIIDPFDDSLTGREPAPGLGSRPALPLAS